MASKLARDGSPRPRPRREKSSRGRNPLVNGGTVVGAVLVVVAVAWTVVHFGKSRRDEPRLIGTWQSDADATIAEMRKSRPVTAEQEQKLRMIFGRMKITYTATTVTSDFNGTVDTQPYQVVGKGADWVVLKARFAISKRDEQFTIRFDGSDAYWADTEGFTVSECFRRVK